MRSKLVLGASLLLAVASCLAGSADGQFEVKVTLNSNGSCTSITGSAIGSSLVQVRCTANVFVNIAQIGSFMPAGFSPAQDTRLPAWDWDWETRLSAWATQLPANAETQATDRTANLAQTLASRLEDNRGTLMALHVAVVAASAEGHFGPPVAMLVSF